MKPISAMLTGSQVGGRLLTRRRLTMACEISGSLSAMFYAMLIAVNIGAESLGFSLLLVSSALFAVWAVVDRRWTFLLLQLFYAASAVIGLFRWGS